MKELLDRKIDHIVYAVVDLDETMAIFEKATGVRPVFGGYHTHQGTKNAIVNLGGAAYLEFLAKDDTNLAVSPPRWMGIDLIQSPQMTRWSLKSTDLAKDSAILKKHDSKLGEIQGGQRRMTNGELLSWEMIMPLAAPEVDIIPFMTDWQKSSVHPTSQLPAQCRLLAMEFSHPEPIHLASTLDQLALDLSIQQADKAAIRAKIEGPAGIIWL